MTEGLNALPIHGRAFRRFDPPTFRLSCMKVIENQTFTKKRIEIDDTQFTGCTFNGCVLVYSGTGGTAMNGCHLNETGFEFEGGAAKTIELLTAMHRGGFRELVEATIAGIRGEQPTPAAPQA